MESIGGGRWWLGLGNLGGLGNSLDRNPMQRLARIRPASTLRRFSSTLASDVYTSNTSSPATTTSPTTLTSKQRRIIEEIIRVDQAGELGANVIYQGQKAVFARQGKVELANLIQVSSQDSVRKTIALIQLVTGHVGLGEEAHTDVR